MSRETKTSAQLREEFTPGGQVTRKKAIEAALAAYDDTGSAEQLADRAYEYGRIAGLREAARIAVSAYVDYDLHGRDKAAVIEDAQDEVAADIRAHARALANPKKPKKARGK